jgi:NAD(P)H-flavin reductase/ferredoxin
VSPRVHFKPIDETIECASDETVLDAAFRQGYNLAYGCREGQCSACKCYLMEGDVALKPYSTFALSESEESNGYTLMCRAMPEQDLTVELLHFDPDAYKLENPIRDGRGEVVACEELTPAGDICRLHVKVTEPEDFNFLPGQYVDLHVPGAEGVHRSFSLSNLPGDGHIELIIRRYPDGRLSSMLGEKIKAGTELEFTGPYGAFHLRRSERPILMLAAGSGMGPVLALLRQLAADGSDRPVRFFFGARTQEDLFYGELIAELGGKLADFEYTCVLSREEWDGARGYVQDTVDGFLEQTGLDDPEVYMCGPPPMIEAAEEILEQKHEIPGRHIHHDKFTTSAEGAGGGGEAETGTATPPVKRMGDGAAPAGDESERQFQWYTPRKRRATLYEDVTVDTQPSVHRHVTRGWPMHFEDGRGIWSDESTKLRSSDWYAFRDPGEQWERTYYQRGTAMEQQIEGAIASAVEEGVLADFRPEWVDFLHSYLQVPAYVEHGLWFAMATAARDCLSDSLSTCVCLQAAMKQRSAQAIVLFAMDLERHHGELPIEAARERFLTEDAWQPTRRYLERLSGLTDWCELIVAANVCFEPLVGTLIRRDLGIRAAAANGDTVTPVLARVATQEWSWARAWTVELIRFLLDDAEHGAANREQVRAWLDEWIPLALEASVALAPIAERLPVGIDVAQSVARVRDDLGVLLAEAGLPEAAEAAGIELPEEAVAQVAAADGEPERAAAPERAARPRVKVTEDAAGVPDPGEAYDYVGIVMAKSAEGDAVASILSRRDEITVLEQPAFWDVRAKDRLVIPYEEVSEQLGYEIDAYSIQHEMSTHYGRMVAGDDALMLFSDPTEAMEHLMS